MQTLPITASDVQLHSEAFPTNDNVSINSNEVAFSDFLEGFKETLKSALHTNSNIDELSINRRLPSHVLAEIMAYKPLSICIPKQFGGRGAPIHENIAIMSAASYESLALSLTLSINYALFLQPVTKYAQEAVKGSIFNRFLNEKNMGGLMITEPDFGSDALNMQTSYTEENGSFHLKGTKHWAGLTGMANYWLLTARNKTNDGLKRDIDFFICDVNAPNQKIVVEEYFENLGLYQIPYGRNLIDVRIPSEQRLVPVTSGIKMMLDVLHRNRLQFPGMGMGFIKRMLDEAVAQCKTRVVGGGPLATYDQVQQRLAHIQACYTICSALCVVGSELAELKNDVSDLGFEANSIKTITTDLMQDASQSLLTLVGAKGYKLNHIAGRAIVDSRPFQIFEGSNDILFIQISETLIKLMGSAKETNLYNYLISNRFTSRAAEYLKDLLNLNITKSMPQRKHMELGRIISRVAAMNCVIRVNDRGFRNDLSNNAISLLQQEISMLLTSYSSSQNALYIDGYQDNSSWLLFVK